MPDIWMDVDAAVTVPCNIAPLVASSDGKTVADNTIAYNETGLEVYWNFVTTAGAITCTPITPTTSGSYDWTHVDGGMYKIEIPASGGASANNDTEGFGWITGACPGGTPEVLPFRGPTIGFRAAALNNSLVDGATVDVNVTAMANNVITAAAINTGAIDADALATDAIDEIFDYVVEGSGATDTTFKEGLRLMLSALVGQVSGAGTTEVTFKACDTAATTRVVATVDASGNRSAVTLTKT